MPKRMHKVQRIVLKKANEKGKARCIAEDMNTFFYAHEF